MNWGKHIILARLFECLSRRPVILGAIVAFGVAIRSYRLGENPAGLFCDEAAIAVNAYSIGKTGRDLSGQLLPLYAHERSFERWNVRGVVYQPVYLYISVPFVKVFGLSPLSIRLPSILFAAAGILGAYCFARAIFDHRMGLLTAILLAISPWHHHFSRIAFEAISFPTLLAFGSYYLYRGLAGGWSLSVGSFLMGLATYAYPTAKVFVPLIMAGFAFIYARELRATYRSAITALIVFSIVLLPNVYTVLAGIHQERVRSLLIFSGDLGGERGFQYLQDASAQGSGWADSILNTRLLLLPFVFTYNYLSHISPTFLFIEGDPNWRHSLPGMGMCFYFYIPLLLMGIAWLIRHWREPRARFLLWWLLCFPVPASLTVGSPHAIRTINALPVLDITAAMGMVTLISCARVHWKGPRLGSWKAMLSGTCAVLTALAVPLELGLYLRQYHNEYVFRSGPAWQAGVVDALRQVKDERERYHSVYVTERVLNSYVFLLFTGCIPIARIDPSLDIDAQMRAFGFHLLRSGIPEHAARRDLLLITATERAKWPDLEIVAKYPYPDGKPNLLLVRGGSR